MNRSNCHLTVKLLPPSGGMQILYLIGRQAWTMMELIKAGERGCTPMENPALRWSGYIHKLREKGVDIKTLPEPHGGDFPGTHARYVLRGCVEVMTSGGFCEAQEGVQHG